MRLARLLLAFLAIWLAVPAAALVPSSQPAATATPPPQTTTTTIEAKREDGADQRIKDRIAGIFLEIPGLADVSVNVSEGVVALSGTVAERDDIARAEAIASRVSGVVTVENTIERDVSVGQQLAGIGALSGKIDSFVRMLPLIGAALLVAAAIGAIGYAIAAVSSLWERVTSNTFLAELIASAIRFIFVIGGIVIALDMLGASTLLGAVLGGAGVIGIALGFAMRDTVENYVASLMLSMRQPFRPNDWVVIESHEGRVIRLTSRATILMTLDGNHLRIPNSTVFKAVILNYTRNPQRRFEFKLGIDADDDPDAGRHVGVNALAALDFVLDTPEPQARVLEVGNSNIVIEYLGWIDQRETDWYKAHSRAIAAVKRALEAAGFSIPEPIYRLRFDSAAPLPAGALEAERAASQPERQSRGKPKPKAKPAPEAARETEPEDEVARMVDAERASTSNEKDLLDPKRPVE